VKARGLELNRNAYRLRSHHFFWLGVVLSLFLILFVVLLFAATQREANRSPVPLPYAAIETASRHEETNLDTRVSSDAKQTCFGGCPTGSPKTNEQISHHLLILSNNPSTKFADWVAYTITSKTLGSHCQRKWMQDPDIPPGDTLSPADYRDVRIALESDRGHQAPLASLCGSPYWQEADYLSNITPQKSSLNEGPWEMLEKAERNLLQHDFATVHSLTGPLYERTMPALPNARLSHAVPSAYWKVIAVEDKDGLRVAAFVMEQDSGRGDAYCSKISTVAEVEKRSGLKFPSQIENDAIRKLLPALGC
jgi:endonuclease G